MSIYLQYVIPIVTFILGAGLTLLLKRYDKQNASLAIYAKEVSDCANEWYNQLYDIEQAVRTHSSKEEIARKLEFYSQNRLILPKFIRALAVLKRHPQARSLVLAAAEMLKILTKEHYAENRLVCESKFRHSGFVDLMPAQIDCLPVGATLISPYDADEHAVIEHGKSLAALVPLLDSHVQKINLEAGRVL